ncbi:MAG TPA: toprim domain-containing protein, partial [Candidatus Moranbacteria bacterium]|nr:toprim domain-containing protein [Candidatus Moranbacteria bacterium]
GNVVAVSGTALTPDQILMLKRYTDNIAMLFDMDSAGQQAAEKSANLCFEKEMNVKVVALSDGKDAADVVQKDPSLLIKSVKESTSAMEYFFKNILGKYDSKSAEGKNNIAKDILEHVAHIENKIEKSSWIKKIAHELDVEENVINSVLKTVESSVVSSVKKQDQAEDQPAAFQKRADVIRDCLLGVIMSDGNIWKETFDKEKESEWVKNDSLISFVLESGPAANFSFDGLMLKIDDERAIEKLRKIYFDTKYRFTAEEITEQSQDDLRKMAGSYKAQYVKELQKERLHSIIREIEKAEQKGDKETLANLMSEFTKLSQETRD